MKVKWLDINGFRGIEHLRLEFDEHINVLVGDNGAGKSAILDCLAILLSKLIGRIGTLHGTGRFFSEYDISNDKQETYSTICINYQDEDVEWDSAHKRMGREGFWIITMRGQTGLRTLAKKINNEMTTQRDFPLPLVVYYPTNRAVLEINLRFRRKHVFEQLAAHDQALAGKRNDFKIFFEWFRQREDLENEKLRDNKNYLDSQLKAVRKAINSFLHEFSGIRIRRSPKLRMTIYKGKKELVINQLSDGEKCLLAMTGDLARRLAIANPGLKNPLEGSAVVLIDEIDLHLHPSWQRTVVPALRGTFKNCQFILTTHSPAILSHVRPENIFILNRTKETVEAQKPQASYGLDCNRIMEDIMKVPEREERIKEELKKLFLEIEKGQLEEASKNLAKIKREIGQDPELTEAQVLIRRKQILGK